MSKNINLNIWEQKVLFDIFDRVRYAWGTVSDHEDLMDRLEQELERYPKKETEHESRTIPAPQTD